jgi:NAD(P)-dependent dehydrogenase (short-subunit alcohol dehydrogenase family)
MGRMNSLPIPWVDPIGISNAVLWLASDEARYVIGVTLPVDAGFCQKIGGTPLVLPEA